MPTTPTGALASASDRIGGETMGTTWSVVLPARVGGAGTHDLHALHAQTQHVLDGIEARMSHWRADSDLSRYNGVAAGWVALPRDLLDVLACALEIARASEGAFDPTLGELAALWGFGPGGAVAAPPAPDALAAAHARAGWEKLRVDLAEGRAWQPGGLALDLSAIAKGYAVDRVVETLHQSGIHALLVEVGGELRGIGARAEGSPWRVLVETAYEQDGDAEPDVIALDGHAVATSGDRWHQHVHAGHAYAHTLDPRTGAPLTTAPMAATVIAPDAMRADAWATALSVVGRERALALADGAGVALRLVERITGATHIVRTAAFERYLIA